MPIKKTDKKLLKELVDKGYGEDERKKRLAIYRKKIQGKQGPRHKNQISDEKEKQKDTRQETSGIQPSIEKEGAIRQGKLLDPKLRRRIDTYAFKNGCIVTGGKERVISLLTIFNPFLKDYVSQDFLKLLFSGKGYKDETPYRYCFFDNMEALYHSVRFLLGYDRVVRNLEEQKARDEKIKELETRFKAGLPLVLIFLKRFIDKDHIIRSTLFSMVQKYRKKRDLKLETPLLGTLVKAYYVFYLTTGRVEEHCLEQILGLVKDLCLFHETDPVVLKHLETALFRFEVAYNNLKEFQHQFFPLLLKQWGTYFIESELRDKERLTGLYTYLAITEEEIITFHGYLENLAANPKQNGPPVPVEKRSPDSTEPGEQEAVESKPPADKHAMQAGEATFQEQPFNLQFGKLLQILKLIFPGSGIGELEEWNYILPYFELNIFSRDPALLPLLMNIARYDFVGQVMVIHRILDNMLTSIKLNVVDAALNEKNEFKQGMYTLLSKWTEAYTELFLPYVKTLNEYKAIKDSRGRITLNNKIKLEKYAAHLRLLIKTMLNLAIKEQLPAKESSSINIRLYELAEELDEFMSRLGRVLKKEYIQKNDPQALGLLKELAKHGAADFHTHSYKPAIKRIKDVLENQYKTANLNASLKAQFTFFEILLLLSHMYNYLLNDPASFYRKLPDAIPLAGADEERMWNRAYKALNGSLS